MSDSILTQSNNNSPFDSIRHLDDKGNEFWYARELMPLLGYKMWQKFNGVIETAKENLETVTGQVIEHFLPVEVKNMDESGKRLKGRSGLDYKLSRLACYHIALCCDSRGNDAVKLAKHYFAVKTREAEVAAIAPVEVTRVIPQRDAVDFIQAAKDCQSLPNGLLKQLLNDMLIDQVSLEQNLKYLPVAEKPKQYTIVKVRAKSLGYTESQIGDGTQLGRFVKARLEPAFQEMIGRFPVYHYEINPDLDDAIHQFF